MTGNRTELVPPGPGRRYRATCIVRLGDVLPSGEARLDAIARYLQDVAADDGRDAGVKNHMAWLVRKTSILVIQRPQLEETVELLTWASAASPRWAERRTTISVGGEAVIEAASIWVFVDLESMRPARIPEPFWSTYGEAVGDRKVTARLNHPEPPRDRGPDRRPWPLRVADIDRLGHVNNAATWVAIDDELDRAGRATDLTYVDLEYRRPIDYTNPVTIESQSTADNMLVWLTVEGTVMASAALSFD
ncbi:MAG: acyl-[acyl-carrier-protein] thioesterase [Acidimicrobiales bacterium]